MVKIYCYLYYSNNISNCGLGRSNIFYYIQDVIGVFNFRSTALMIIKFVLFVYLFYFFNIIYKYAC